ncbi:Bacterio-opsin activator HTH domain protein [Caldivirga maquilingensis IC-167]|uniref:Bacterio-opsin activator HTH domain protein n=2 Tax=Caldivirga maquilingensis TaxID=76887 RepID=A8MAG6_CALMQ|nr:Bacterio-opsin activator HTH domain protein [Caldivirga maquilingensis IC-167]
MLTMIQLTMPIQTTVMVIEHDDWSVFTRDTGVKATVESSIPIPSLGIKRSVVNINASSIGEVKELMRRIKEFRQVKAMNVLDKHVSRNNVTVTLSTIRVLNNSVLELLLNNNVYYYRELITSGLEYWLVVASDLSNLIRELRERAWLRIIKNTNVNALLSNAPLTRRETQILKVAYETGYFNWPRGISLSQLASKLSISKATLAEELRSIERKLVQMELYRDNLLNQTR